MHHYLHLPPFFVSLVTTLLESFSYTGRDRSLDVYYTSLLQNLDVPHAFYLRIFTLSQVCVTLGYDIQMTTLWKLPSFFGEYVQTGIQLDHNNVIFLSGSALILLPANVFWCQSVWYWCYLILRWHKYISTTAQGASYENRYRGPSYENRYKINITPICLHQ